MTIGNLKPVTASPPASGFIAENHTVSSGTTSRVTALPVGTAAGDLVLCLIENALGAGPTLPAGFTSIGTGSWPSYLYNWEIGYKVASAGDITTGSYTGTGVETNAPMILMTYRGSTVATLINDNDDVGAGLSQAGFVKAGGSDQVVSLVMDRDHSGNPTVPAGWTARTTTYLSGYFAIRYADIASAGYVNGTAVVWSTFTNGFDQHGWLVELT